MTEREPKEIQKVILTKAQFHRGTIVSGYAQIEFLLLDLTLKARKLPEYQTEQGPFPYRLESRIHAVKRIFALPGRLAVYNNEFSSLIGEINKFEELRHFMAHGAFVATFASNSHVLNYRMYRQGPKGAIEIGRIETDLDQLGRAARDISAYANTLLRLFRRMYLEQKLEAI